MLPAAAADVIAVATDATPTHEAQALYDPRDTMEEDEPQTPKSKNTLVIALAAVMIAGGAGAFFVFGGGGAQAANGEAEGPVESGPPLLVDMDPFIVNLNEPGAGRYLKISVSLAVRGESAKEAITARTAPIRHRVLTYLAGLSFADTQGDQAKTVIQNKLLELANAEFKKQDLIEGVYFTEFVIQ